MPLQSSPRNDALAFLCKSGWANKSKTTAEGDKVWAITITGAELAECIDVVPWQVTERVQSDMVGTFLVTIDADTIGVQRYAAVESLERTWAHL